MTEAVWSMMYENSIRYLAEMIHEDKRDGTSGKWTSGYHAGMRDGIAFSFGIDKAAVAAHVNRLLKEMN